MQNVMSAIPLPVYFLIKEAGNVRAGRKGKIDESGLYYYCDLCNGIKYYITLEQAEGRKEFTGCLEWGMV